MNFEQCNKLAIWLLFIIFFSKALLISLVGSQMPFWDAWDAEAMKLYLPWEKGSLTLADMFSPHNEHRVFFTRVFALAIFELNGNWSPITQAFFSSALCALFAVMLYQALAKVLFRESDQKVLLVFVVFLYCVPFAWTNTLFGFHNHFHFMALFSLGAIGLMLTYSVDSIRWWLGLAMGMMSVFTMSSGIFALICPLAMLLLTFIVRGRSLAFKPGEIMALLAIIVCLVFALSIMVTVPQHDKLQVGSVYDFLYMFLKVFSWPLPSLLFLSLLVCLPLLVNLILYLNLLRTQQPVADSRKSELVMLAIGAWVAMQVTAIAFARGATGTMANRYVDILLIGIIVALVSFFNIRKYIRGEHRLKGYRWITRGWLLTLVSALTLNVVFVTLPNLEQQSLRKQAQWENVSKYLQTQNISHLQDKPVLHIPYPNEQRLAQILSNPDVRRFLPHSLRSLEEEEHDISRLTPFFIGILVLMMFSLPFVLANRSEGGTTVKV